MASKRPGSASSPPATPSKKKKKGSNQPSLASFLTSPSSTKPRPPPLDPDEEFALKLAAQDAGVSLEEMRRRVKAGKKSNGNQSASIDSDHATGEAAPIHPMFQKGTTAAAHNSDEQADRRHPLKTPSPEPTRLQAGPSTPRKGAPFDFASLDADIESIDFTQDVLVFDPNCVPTSAWPRAADDSTRPTTPYALLSHAFIIITGTNSRLLIVTVLTNLMRTIRAQDPSSLISAIYLITNHIAPSYEDVQLGVGSSITNKAIKSVTGKSAQTLRTLWNATGDPGDVAFEAKKDVKPMMKPPPLTVQKVFSTLHAIAALTHSGTGSTNAKFNLVTKLLVASRGEEARWLVRTFHSHLRIGAVKKTLSSAIARCFSLAEQSGKVEEEGQGAQGNDVMVLPKERLNIMANPTKAKDRQVPQRLVVMAKFAKAERLVREVLARHPSFTALLNALLLPGPEGGLPHLSALVPLRIGVPISPMLGSITRSLADAFQKLGVSTPNARSFVSEFKYDGQRVQIHATRVAAAAPDPTGKLSESAKARRKEIDERGRGKWIGPQGDIYVRLFSRHLDDMTSKYPDILDLIPMLMSPQERDGEPARDPVQSFIMDAEVVAIGEGGDTDLLPFQTLSNRSRKDVNLKEVKVKVGVFAFDLMYLDGKSLLKSSLRVRRKALHSRFPPLTPDNPLIARFRHVKSTESNDPEEVERFFQDARANRCEGIMVKTLDHHWQSTPQDGTKLQSEDNAANAEVEDNSESDAGEMHRLGDEVSDDLVMEEDLAELDAKVSKIKKKGSNVDEEDAETVPESSTFAIGKGVTGRGKALLSTYEPDKRCESWLKVKQDYVDGIGDSLDLVPIAAWHGMGRKAKWWSPVLLAVYDEDDDTYYAVTKCISGFTDAEYKSIKFERFPESEEPGASCYNARSQRCRHSYDTGGYLPDVWFEPLEVWELRFADITLSPVYPAAKGIVSEERGLSCRFPRFIKRREDKGPHQASTPRQLAKMYFDQRSNAAVSTQVQAGIGDENVGPEGIVDAKVLEEDSAAD